MDRTTHRPTVLRVLLAGLLLALAVASGMPGAGLLSAPAQASTAPGFRDVTVLRGLTAPTAVRFASDGRVFVAEKSGLIKVFSSLTDTTPTVFADLRGQVQDLWDRGLLGLALAPGFPADPWVYVLYTYDAAPGGTAPRWGDACPDPPTGPGANTDGCVVTGRLSRLQASGSTMTGTEQVLVTDWCQQFPSHSIGDLAFAADGSLLVSGGDGASFTQADWGQLGGSTGKGAANVCGDPPSAAGTALTPPSAAGGALRSQSVRRTGGPAVLSGAVLRLDPATGAGSPGNPYASSTDANARRVIASGMRNPFRFAVRPGTSEVWVGDVGWDTYEEVDRIRDAGDAVAENFGWPCYEGAGRQPVYEQAGLSLCSSLYATAGAVTPPVLSYRHDADVVAGDGCAHGGSISGMAFNTGTRYPAAYDGALMFADYSRGCIWAMQVGADGPDPTKVSALITGAASPVGLTAGPDGYLYYAAVGAGEVHRVEYATPPVAGPGTYLSDLTPTGTPVNGWGPLERDQSNGEQLAGDGHPLTIGGVAFAKGLGAHAASDASWTVPAGCSSFSSTVGVDDEVGASGSVVFTLWSGTTQLWTSGRRTGADPGLAVSVPVTAGAPLRLVVGDAGDGTDYDHGDWADAKLTCEAPPGPALSDLTPVGTPVNGWGPVERDQSNGEQLAGDGHPITVGGVVFAKGLGTHAGSDVRYTVPAGCTSFSATVGVDDEVAANGSVVFDVAVAGATAYTSGRRTGADPGTSVLVAVQPGDELRLSVGDAGDGNAYDHADWADARFGCPGGTPPPPPSGNRPPVPVIDAPSPSLTWKVGDRIDVRGHATDPEDGALPGTALSWALVLRHCTDATTCHSHPVSTVSGASASFTAPDHPYPSYLSLELTATDSGGATATSAVRLDPQTVDLTFSTNPGGLKLSALGAGSAVEPTPFTKTFIVGGQVGLVAPATQVFKKATYSFVSWSDGGALSHTVVAPATARTYTATYRK